MALVYIAPRCQTRQCSPIRTAK